MQLISEALPPPGRKSGALLSGAVAVALAFLLLWLTSSQDAPPRASAPENPWPMEKVEAVSVALAPVATTEPSPAAAVQPAATEVASPKAPPTAPEHGDLLVHVVDPSGAGLANVDIWLAKLWHKPAELRGSTGIPHASTNQDGFATLRVPRGKYCVHAAHPNHVQSLDPGYGNTKSKVEVVDRSEVTIRMSDVFVIAYQFAPVGVVATAVDHGTDYEVVHAEWSPVAGGALDEIANRIMLRFPGSRARAFVHDGRDGKLGRWRVHVSWVGRTPTTVPIQIVKLGDFVAPDLVGFGDSAPSPEFGTVLLQGVEGFLVQAERLGPKGFPPSFLSMPGVSFDLRLGEPAALPSGTYKLRCDQHPFLSPDLNRAGPLTVSAGSFEERTIAFARPLRRVGFDLRLPEGYEAKPFMVLLHCMQSGTQSQILGHNLSDMRSWWLPEGDYRLRMSMATENSMSLVLHSDTFFRVVPGVEAQSVVLDLSPQVPPPQTPLEFR